MEYIKVLHQPPVGAWVTKNVHVKMHELWLAGSLLPANQKLSYNILISSIQMVNNEKNDFVFISWPNHIGYCLNYKVNGPCN